MELGFADRDAVEAAVEATRENGGWLGEALLESGALTSEQLARALAERNGLDYVDLNVFEVDKGAANLVSATEARRFRAIPVAFIDSGTILVATSNPANVLGLDDIAITTGYKVRRAVASPEDIEAVINQLSNLEESVQEVDEETRDPDFGAQVIELRESAEEAPVVKLVHSVIADAVGRGASDIHFDPRQRRHAGPVPGRRGGGRLGHRSAAPRPRPRLPDQDHGRARHRRAPRPPGRPHRPHGRWSTTSTSASPRCRWSAASRS